MNSLEFLLGGIIEAVRMIVTLDPYVLSVTKVQLFVNLSAITISSIIAISLAIILAFKDFIGKKFVILVLNTFMGLPPVVVGLIVLLLLSASGPLGFLKLLYTPQAMIIAQCILATPIIASMSLAAIKSVGKELKETALTLGADKIQLVTTILKEARYGVLIAVLAGFGRVVAEVGAILIVGGNIVYVTGESYTRTLTTAITVEASMGNIAAAIAFGIILIIIAFIINFLLNIIHKRI